MKGSSKKGLVLVAIVIVLLAIAGIGAYLYFQTDLLGGRISTKEKFLKSAMSINLDELVKEVDFSTEYMKKLEESSYEMNTTAKLNLSGELAEQLNGFDISKFKLNVDTKRDAKNTKTHNDIKLLYLDNELFDLKAVADKDKYALKSEEIVKDRYLGTKKENLISLLNRLGLKIDLDELNLDGLKNTSENINIEKYKTLFSEENLNKYKDVILNNIPDDNFVEEKGASISTKFGNKTVDAIGVVLNEKELTNILKEFLLVLKSDTQLLNAVVEISELSGNAITLDELQEEIQYIITNVEEVQNEANTETDTDSVESKLNIVLYVENQKVVKMTFKLEADESVTLDIDFNLNAGDNAVNFSLTTKDEESETSTVAYIERKNSDNTDNLKCQISLAEDKETIVTGEVNIEQTLVSTNSYENNVYIKFNYEETNYGIDLNNKVNFKDDVQIDDLTSENTTMFDEMSDADLNSTVSQIITQIQSVFTQKMKQLVIIMSNTNTGVIDQPNTNN